MRACIVLFLCFVANSYQVSTPNDDHYVAAVVEFRANMNTEENLNDYVRLIQDASAQGADVIVFPEMTLNSRDTVTIPIHTTVMEHPIPALAPEYYEQLLITLSDAASQNNIYVVVNVQESMDCKNAPGEYCPEEKLYLFNTNVVFDRKGAIIDRYRKIHLFGERGRTPALKPDLGVFETDFGVTFGHFICFDLQFQVPSIQVVQKKKVTDVIFTTYWFSELPFLTAVQIQEAYAIAKNVNFLAAGANQVVTGTAGSGIYSGRAGALISVMPGVDTTRLLVAKVPKIPGKVEPGSYPGPQYDDPTTQDRLFLLQDPSLSAHISKVLEHGHNEFTLTDKEVTCSFKVTLNNGSADSIYQYRAIAFDGVRTFSGLASGGGRTCAVVACRGPQIEDCGLRFDNYVKNGAGVFEELFIKAEMPSSVVDEELEADNVMYFPISLDTSIMPLQPTLYEYQKSVVGSNAVMTFDLKVRDVELLTFAVWGRVYGRDGEVPTIPTNDALIMPSPYKSIVSAIL